MPIPAPYNNKKAMMMMIVHTSLVFVQLVILFVQFIIFVTLIYCGVKFT